MCGLPKGKTDFPFYSLSPLAIWQMQIITGITAMIYFARLPGYHQRQDTELEEFWLESWPFFCSEENKRTVSFSGEISHVMHLCCLCKLRLSLLFPEFIIYGLLWVFADGFVSGCTPHSWKLHFPWEELCWAFSISQQSASFCGNSNNTWSALIASTLLTDLLTGAVARLIMR